MKKISRLFWGLGFITLAVFLVLSQMHLITAQFSVWNAIVGLLCAALLISSIADRSFGGVFFSLGLFWLTFAETLGLPKVSIWNILIIILLLTTGFNIIFPHKHKKLEYIADGEWENSKFRKYQNIVDEENGGIVSCSNSFGELSKYINVPDFKQAHIKNSFGELKLYLDQAQPADTTVNIEVSNSFGQTTLFIPKDWNVIQSINVFLGSVDEKRRSETTTQVTCYITGSVSFGEIEIVYV